MWQNGMEQNGTLWGADARDLFWGWLRVAATCMYPEMWRHNSSQNGMEQLGQDSAAAWLPMSLATLSSVGVICMSGAFSDLPAGRARTTLHTGAFKELATKEES